MSARSQWSLDAATGHLICEGNGGHEWLRWDKELGDCIFHVEWRFTVVPGKKGYNSGVYARNSADATIYHQAQTGDASGGYLFGNTKVNGTAKRFNLSKQHPESRVKPAGEWNVFEITCRGKEMTLWVNGAVVNQWPDCEVPAGYVGLEAEGFRIEFRNAKVKSLDAASPGKTETEELTIKRLPEACSRIKERATMRVISRALAARTVIALLVSCVCHAHWDASARGGELQVGAAMRVITPNPLLPVSGGMGIPNPTREKKGDLTARAVVFRNGDVTVAVVALDLLGFPSALGDRVRTQVSRIPADHILIGSTHTHSAPDCYAFPDGKGGHTGDLKYMDFVCNRAAEALNEAIDRLEPASIKIATGEAQGKIAYNYYAPDLYDRRMSVIQARNLQGKTIATLVNYAVHPEVLGNDVGILSPDLVGPLCEKLEATAGGMAIFMNSAQGGMVTADNRNLDQPRDPQRGYWNDARSWEECLRIGHLMAERSRTHPQ